MAVALLGVGVSADALAAVGPAMLAGIALVVALSVAGGYAIARAFGLPRRMAVLIAAGNSICGNSAIAAVAPVIGAEPDDVASAIAFTAVLGVGVVLAVPALAAWLGLAPLAAGAFAGLTVYAVPQVLAAAAPAGAAAVQVGALVKLTRVVALGPVCLALGLLSRRRAHADLRRLVPWFVVAFLALAALRAAGVLPPAAVHAAGQISTWLTIAAMAALGLGTDVRALLAAGPRVVAAASLSLLLLGLLALGLLTLLGWA
ncbi:YeiH family protein [Phenylobacterium sp.]|uniref:YeiH family protein n=1 Tax=Phenylobacterium sp. TaxID=1871053 RepID=UPI0035B1370F